GPGWGAFGPPHAVVQGRPPPSVRSAWRFLALRFRACGPLYLTSMRFPTRMALPPFGPERKSRDRCRFQPFALGRPTEAFGAHPGRGARRGFCDPRRAATAGGSWNGGLPFLHYLGGGLPSGDHPGSSGRRRASVSSYPQPGRAPGFATVLHTCAQAPDLPFRDVLTAGQIQALADEEGVSFGEGPGCVWSVALTLWTFAAQML